MVTLVVESNRSQIQMDGRHKTSIPTAASTLLSATLSYLVTMPQLSQHDLVPALDDPGTWHVLAGTVYSLIAAAMFSLGIGTLLRSTAATVTAAL